MLRIPKPRASRSRKALAVMAPLAMIANFPLVCSQPGTCGRLAPLGIITVPYTIVLSRQTTRRPVRQSRRARFGLSCKSRVYAPYTRRPAMTYVTRNAVHSLTRPVVRHCRRRRGHSGGGRWAHGLRPHEARYLPSRWRIRTCFVNSIPSPRPPPTVRPSVSPLLGNRSRRDRWPSGFSAALMGPCWTTRWPATRRARSAVPMSSGARSCPSTPWVVRFPAPTLVCSRTWRYVTGVDRHRRSTLHLTLLCWCWNTPFCVLSW